MAIPTFHYSSQINPTIKSSNPMKPPYFPLVFLWFSLFSSGFPMIFPIFLGFSYGFPEPLSVPSQAKEALQDAVQKTLCPGPWDSQNHLNRQSQVRVKAGVLLGLMTKTNNRFVVDTIVYIYIYVYKCTYQHISGFVTGLYLHI